MTSFLKYYKMTNRLSLLVILFSMICYSVFAYGIDRTQFTALTTLYTFLFISFYLLYNNSEISTKHLIYIGVAFRFVFIAATPNLSDDFYRFLWDGRALFNGINPYLILPENNPQLITDGANLYQGMGRMNGSHYTCYPPLNQIAFSISSFFSESNLLISTIVMRFTLILSDIVIVIFGLKILKELKLDTRKILLYFINPYILIELTGNLHYEGMMIAFLSASMYYLLKNKNHTSSILFACAVSIKLIPLIFFPVFYKRLGFKKMFVYGLITLVVSVLLFIPFASNELYTNFMSSIELYFQNFEFNASIYYIIREIGYHVKGYNIIHTVGRITPFVIILATLGISFYRQNKKSITMLESMLFIITVYYLLSSIVHPWYLAIPVFLSIFLKYNYSLLWSFTIILSYSAYIAADYHENLYLVALEYSIVTIYCIYQFVRHKKLNKLPIDSL